MRVRKQLARDAPKRPRSSSSGSPIIDLAAQRREREARRAKVLRQAARDGARPRKAVTIPPRRTHENSEKVRKDAQRKIVRAARAKLLRRRIESRIARKKASVLVAEEKALRSRLSATLKRQAARRIMKTLRGLVKKRKSQQRKAAAKIQRFYRAREALRRAERMAVVEEQVQVGSGSSRGGGGGGGLTLSSAVPKSIRKVLARLIARKKRQRMVKRKIGSKRCPRGYRRMRKTRFCGTRSLLRELPRLRRRIASPSMSAPKSLLLDTKLNCPKGYKRVRRLDAAGNRVRSRKCKRILQA
jgi:hypothetical protein